ncbi:MAG: toast rack family protein [Chloroflexi bacterium]|nr:toast rack family protein [Chloroflexota bacterium]
MKRPLLLVVVVLMLASLACSINLNVPSAIPKLGPTETFTVSQPLPSGNQVSTINLQMGAGTLDLTGGSSELISGTIDYNVTEWKPSLTSQGDEITLKQEQVSNITLTAPTNVVNDWKLKLSDSAPLDLNINAGAYKGTIDLSGVPLQNLAVNDGASDTQVHFNSLNPVTMQQLNYKTGASQVKLYGLANANFEEMTFDSGAGNYTLDFTGTLQRDATVNIKSGVSQITIFIPSGMSAKIIASGGLNNINTEGTWTTSGDTYETTGSGPTLTIHVDMGLGNLNLYRK